MDIQLVPKFESDFGTVALGNFGTKVPFIPR